MRVVRIANSAEARRIVSASAKEAPGTLEKLNPHLDLSRLAPGAVLVLPDSVRIPGPSAASPDTIASEAMKAFIGYAQQAFDAAAQRMKSGAERAAADEAALASAAKSKGVKSALDKDPELKALLDGALRQAKEDTQATAEAVKGLATLSKSALTELETLAKRLG